MRRGRAALVALGAMAVVATQPGCLVRWMMTPNAAFDEQVPPAPPDYADPASWSALPDREDAGDAVPPGLPAVDQASAPADVFYVHPTSYVAGRWNGPVDDEGLNRATDTVATGIQATAFNGCCAVWAPRYRQANGTSFYAPSADGDRALDLAYADVSRAFDVFLSRTGERPLVLAAHSQGAILLERLLYERIAGTPLEDRLVYAVLPGGRVTTAGLAAHGLRPCAAPDDLGCVVAWNARSPDFEPTRFEIAGVEPTERLCTNPLTWTADGAHAPASDNHGAVFLDARDPRPRPGFADARCVDGTLEVTTIGRAPRSLPSRILDHLLGEGNHHPIEVQLYFVDLRRNAELRVRTWLEREAGEVR